MLSDRYFCPVCPVLTVMLVYCGQTVIWINMPLGMEVELDPGHIVLDGDPAASTKRGTASPIFGPCLLWPNGWMDQLNMPLGTEVGLGPGHILLYGDPAPPLRKGHSSPHFSVHVYCVKTAKWITMPLNSYGGRPGPRPRVRWGPISPQKGTAPDFRPYLFYGQTAGWIKMPLRR